MQIRKLVKSGLSSFTVALPKEWIDKNKMKKGDFLYIDEHDNLLSISAEPKKEKKEKKELVINTEGKSERILRREIRSAYINDYDRIYIKGPNIKTFSAILKKDVHDLVSMETIEESADKIVARNFLDFSEITLSDLVRRIDNITRSMLSDAVSCVEVYSSEYDTAQLLKERDADVNRLTFLVFKILKTCATDQNTCDKIHITNLEMLQYWHLVFIIEKIADESKRIARRLKELHSKKSKIDKKGLKHLFEEVKDHYETVMKAFYKKDMNLSDEIYIKKSALLKECDDYFEANKCFEISEITGKFKSIVSQSDDISKIIRYLN
jgi:phosphate uptake regulator